MKVAIVGSRTLSDLDIAKYIPNEVSLVISGGARGVDMLAERFAQQNNIPMLVFLPDYIKHKAKAPIVRNRQIVSNADLIIAIWNGTSTGTRFVIGNEKKLGYIMVHIYCFGV